MRLLLAANNQATRRNEIIKSYLQLGSSSNRYAPRLPQQETKSSTKQLPPTDPILGPENLLKTGFAQKGLPSTLRQQTHKVSKVTSSQLASRTVFIFVKIALVMQGSLPTKNRISSRTVQYIPGRHRPWKTRSAVLWAKQKSAVTSNPVSTQP